MTVLFDWLASDGGCALLLALAHSVPVGGLVWAVLAWAFRRLPARRCQLRYGLALGAQALVCLVTLFLWSWFAHESTEAQVAPASSRPGTAAAIEPVAMDSAATETAEVVPAMAPAGEMSPEAYGGLQSEPLPQANQRSTADAVSRQSAAWPQWWGLAWLAGALVVLVSRMWLLGQTWRLSACCPVVTDGPWQTLLAEERLRMAYRKTVVLRVVDGLASPAAWGFFRPVILIPASMASGLSPETMRMILAHELSHLRRWDPLVQALQYVVEALFFFNPFIWLLSRQIALEREACCDAVAADRTDGPTYAEVLLQVGRQAGRSGHDVAAPAALGDGKPSSLAARIRRLLRPADCPSPRLSLRLLLLAVLIAVVASFVGRQASDAAVAALTHLDWIQQIQTAVEQERREQGPDWEEGDEMVLKGRITNQAGEALSDASVRLLAHYADGTGNYGFSSQVDAQGYYRLDVSLVDRSTAQRPYASFTLTAAAPNYGVEQRKRMLTGKGEKELNIILELGLTVEIEFVDEAGAAIAATDLEFEYAWQQFRFGDHYTTDAEGRLRLLLPSEKVLRLTVQSAGYRDWRGQKSFGSDRDTLRITLRQGVPIRGVVRDRVSGEPIADAGVFLIRSLSPDGRQSRGLSFNSGRGDPLARTNAAGVFEIHSLEEDWLHWLVIDAEGYLVGFPGSADSRKSRKLDSAFSVTPGDEVVEVNLIPQQPLAVKILPPEGWPPEGGTSGRIRYSHGYYVSTMPGGGSSHGSPLWRQSVELKEGVIKTTLQPTMATPLRIQLNPRYGPELTVEGWNYGEPIVVDLRDQPLNAVVEREYIVRFDLPDSAPLPQGEINVHYVDGSNGSGKMVAPLKQGRAQFTLRHRIDRVPKIDASGVVGYLFEEQELRQPEAGSEGPVVHTVRALRTAGALTLRLANADTGHSAQVELEVYEALNEGFFSSFWSEKDWVTEHRLDIPAGESEAVINPVPLGKKLRVSVHQAHSWTREVLPPIREADPFPRHEIRIPAGERVSGRVLDPAGQPAGRTTVWLDFVYDHLTDSSFSRSHFRTDTDADGYFEFERVNFNAPGIHFLRVESGAGYRQYRALLEKNQRKLQIRLKAAIPRTIRVEVAETGAPIEGRELEINEIGLPADRRFLARSFYPRRPTNAKGELPIETLPASGRFNFRVWFPIEEGGRSGFNEEREIDADDQTIVIRVPEAQLRR